MKRFFTSVIFFILLFSTTVAQPRTSREKQWPYPIPARIQDGSNRDIFVITLGDVATPLADGVYDPARDEFQSNSGAVTANYYREKLGVKYYQPVDKSVFPLPPSGWCSWYYYYQEISEAEVKHNARWVAEHLKDYGARYIQIDDGWQGTGHGRTRDWTTVDKRFPGGMDGLASYITSLGLTPGIWIAPHGQSNEEVVKNNPGVFLLKPDGTTASDTWEGKWLVDPSVPESHRYLKDLFTRLVGWGYEYFKIDGQTVVINEYKTKTSFMKNPPRDPIALYRQTVETVKNAIGPNRYLLGCWGIPVEGMGIMNGSRTGGDIVLDWEGGFKTALDATMDHYYLHNVAWYCDPDVMVLRSPLTFAQAQAWATLQGLTGQALLASDRMMDLSDERVELLRRIYPPVDARPLDLFPAARNKRIWDLKVNHLGRAYDVIGVFNFEEGATEQLLLRWNELGIQGNGPVHVFDFWNREYLGAWEQGMAVAVSPTSCRVLTLLPATGNVQLISTSRHITQGWVDLVSQAYDSIKSSFSGKSNVVGNDLYELNFVFPRGRGMKIKTVTARAATGALATTFTNRQGWGTARVVPTQTGEISWDVVFEPAELYHFPVREPGNIVVEPNGLDGAVVRWNPQYYLNAGYQVSLNGVMQGFAPTAVFPLRGLDPNERYVVEVQTIWDDGTRSEKKGEHKFVLDALLPEELPLADVEPSRAISGWRRVQMNRSVVGNVLSLAGKHYSSGIGTHAASELEYDVRGLYDTFSVLAGIDDANNNDTSRVEFFILGDGKELWRSGIMKKKDGHKTASVSIAGVQRLLLRVSDGGDGIRFDHADWVDATLKRKGKPQTK